MSSIFRFSLFLLLLELVSGCVKEIPLNLGEFPDDIVVNGVFRAFEPISISANRMLPIFESGSYPFDSTLDIVLFREGIAIDTLVFAENRYSSEELAIPGISYSVQIELMEGYKLDAATKVPGSISELECTFTAGRIFDEHGEPITECAISFSDDDSDDYYLLYLGDYDYYGEDFSIRNQGSYWQLNDPVLVNEGILEYKPSVFIFSDELFQDQHYTMQLKYSAGARLYGGSHYEPRPAWCILQKISVEYYYFMKSFLRHSFNQQYFDPSRIDPIQFLHKGQPTDLYTNISNGLGILGSCIEISKEFEYIPPK
jgi:hypothetical protein